jgi:ribulose-5-phosphate 4-epimerase/fuculose-1-phosphate aldolase
MEAIYQSVFKPSELDFSNIPHITEQEIKGRVELAACYRLAAMYGWDDHIYTHISAAIPDASDTYLINPFGLLFSEVAPNNLAKVNLKGDIIYGEAINKTGFMIHGAVHRHRPDAQCVMHLHNNSAIAVSVLQTDLLPISQHALRFYKDLAYCNYAGLAVDPEFESEMITSLSDKQAMLLRNHGSLVCGQTIQQAFYLMDTLNKACEIQLLVGDASRVEPSPAVCELTFGQLLDDSHLEGQIEWPAYLRKLIHHQRNII